MFTSFSEFKFFQAFRIPVESGDDVRFTIEKEDDYGKMIFVGDGKLLDISLSGMGFSSSEKIPVGANVRIAIQFKRLRFDVIARIVRALNSQDLDSASVVYGAELDEEEPSMRRFIEQYIQSFAPDRLKDSLIQLALSDKFDSPTEGFEMFSLMLSLFKDITKYGNKEEFVESMLEEVSRILNAQRASILLINPDTNELEAVAALGIAKELLKFDYRKGIAGSVFTSGLMLNIDTQSDKIRFSDDVDRITGFETKSIICAPISNREDKIVGVIEVLNKRNEDRFTVEDEKTVKVLSLLFSSVFHNYNPVSEKTLIRRFSTPHDRKFVMIGKSPMIGEIRQAIVKLKDLELPLLIEGEIGVGKRLLAQIIHNEGKRGLKKFNVVNCFGSTEEELAKEIFGEEQDPGKLEQSHEGSIVFNEISHLPLPLQKKLIRALKDKKLLRGVDNEHALDVRAIFTNSKKLKKMAFEDGLFVQELYDFMATSIVSIGPLRKRLVDIPLLVSYFLKKECKKQGLLMKEFAPQILEMFQGYDWPGNVYELAKAIEKAVLYNPKSHVIFNVSSDVVPILESPVNMLQAFEDIPHAKDHEVALKDRVSLIEREMILAEIKRNKGNKSRAALQMGISREALRKKLIQSDKIIEELDQESAPAVEKAVRSSDHEEKKAA